MNAAVRMGHSGGEDVTINRIDRQRGNGVPKAGGAFYYLRSQSRSVVDTAC